MADPSVRHSPKIEKLVYTNFPTRPGEYACLHSSLQTIIPFTWSAYSLPSHYRIRCAAFATLTMFCSILPLLSSRAPRGRQQDSICIRRPTGSLAGDPVAVPVLALSFSCPYKLSAQSLLHWSLDDNLSMEGCGPSTSRQANVDPSLHRLAPLGSIHSRTSLSNTTMLTGCNNLRHRPAR